MFWMIKFGTTAVVAIAALRLGANYDVHTIVTTTESQNYAVAAKYLNRRTHNTVLVGSSLTFRLSENYFRSDDIENLSLAGGSPAKQAWRLSQVRRRQNWSLSKRTF
ncbi:hypothetical protein ACVW0J_004388 [Bradyrhizobium sp. i1.7.7]